MVPLSYTFYWVKVPLSRSFLRTLHPFLIILNKVNENITGEHQVLITRIVLTLALTLFDLNGRFIYLGLEKCASFVRILPVQVIRVLPGSYARMASVMIVGCPVYCHVIWRTTCRKSTEKDWSWCVSSLLITARIHCACVICSLLWQLFHVPNMNWNLQVEMCYQVWTKGLMRRYIWATSYGISISQIRFYTDSAIVPLYVEFI